MSNSQNALGYLAPRFTKKKKAPTLLLFNILAFLMIAMVFVLFVWGFQKIKVPIVAKENQITLDYFNLLEYSMRTTLRMFFALVASMIFTLIYATLAAKNKYCEQILIPLLDILQSIPILGYISFTITGLMAFFPGKTIGIEMAAIFAIFTSQVWNMTFSLYQSLITVPKELEEVARMLEMSKWQKFWRLEMPYSMPSLVWNIVLSMSGGWFFVIASEVITVGDNHITLPGIGSYISLALEEENVIAIIYGVITMSAVILLYDQILIRPLVVWSDKFRYEMTSQQVVPKSWVLSLFNKSILTKYLLIPIKFLAKTIVFFPLFNQKLSSISVKHSEKIYSSWRIFDYFWYISLFVFAIFASYELIEFFNEKLLLTDILYVFKLTSITLLRVVLLIIIASVVWVPIGVYIGLNPRLTAIAQPIIQFLAAFPINLFFPISVITITHFKLNPEIWLSFLMILGAQWFILFNVIAGILSCPSELKEVAANLNIKGWIWWKKFILPTIMPSFLVGVVTASGTAWNTSIIAEVISYGDTKIVATGIGSYVTENTIKADFHRITLGIGMMCLFVVSINRFFWKPLTDFINKKYNFN
jgi:NitT/TauT family transport system permease protein